MPGDNENTNQEANVNEIPQAEPANDDMEPETRAPMSKRAREKAIKLRHGARRIARKQKFKAVRAQEKAKQTAAEEPQIAGIAEATSAQTVEPQAEPRMTIQERARQIEELRQQLLEQQQLERQLLEQLQEQQRAQEQELENAADDIVVEDIKESNMETVADATALEDIVVQNEIPDDGIENNPFNIHSPTPLG